MHGMILKALEAHVRAMHGDEAWAAACGDAGQPARPFEALERYGYDTFDRLADASADRLGLDRDGLLEDLGTWLCTDPGTEAIRRLLRFSGRDFPEFLHSLDELPGRAALAVPGLHLPRIRIVERGGGAFRVKTAWPVRGAGAILIGMLRAMADDYGALATIESDRALVLRGVHVDIVSVRLVADDFAPAREFSLALAPPGLAPGWPHAATAARTGPT